MQEYELIYRFFERTLIHERRYMFTGQSERQFAFSYFDRATHRYFRDQLANIRHFALPVPNNGSFEVTDFGLRRLGIYMDDLCLCRNCGCFFFKAEVPYIFDLIRSGSGSFRQIMKSLIASRADTPEFTIEPCPDVSQCRESTSRQEWQIDRDKRISAIEFSPANPVPKAVYLLRSSDSYKIGIAVNVTARIKALQSACPSPITLLKAWTPADARRCEKMLHTKYRQYRVTGEWFELPAAEVACLERLEELTDEARVEHAS